MFVVGIFIIKVSSWSRGLVCMLDDVNEGEKGDEDRKRNHSDLD